MQEILKLTCMLQQCFLDAGAQHKLHHTPDGRWLLVAQRPHLLEVEHLAISVRDDAQLHISLVCVPCPTEYILLVYIALSHRP